jgi:hypothetical protein
VNVLLTARKNHLSESEVEDFPFLTRAQKQKYLVWLRRGNEELEKCSKQLGEHIPDWTKGPDLNCKFDELPPIPTIDRNTPITRKVELQNLLLYEGYEWTDFQATEGRGRLLESIAIIETPVQSSTAHTDRSSPVGTCRRHSQNTRIEEIEILDSSDDDDDSTYSPAMP